MLLKMKMRIRISGTTFESKIKIKAGGSMYK
jgi:hypothetical protein